MTELLHTYSHAAMTPSGLSQVATAYCLYTVCMDMNKCQL